MYCAGGAFSLRVVFSDGYPEKPPRVRFTCNIFHPNVYADGTICMDIIQDQWSPIHNISTLLTSIQVAPHPPPPLPPPTHPRSS